MASNSASAVLSGRPNVAGAVFSAPAGTTLPSDPTTPLAETFTALGYVSEDGLTNTYSRDSEQIREWGGQIVRVLQTDVTDTWQLALIQAGSPDVLKEVFGAANVTVTPADEDHGEQVSIARNGDPLPSKVFVFDMVDGANKRRVILGNAQITETEDVAYQRGAAIQYGITITAYPDASGVTSTELTDNGNPSAE